MSIGVEDHHSLMQLLSGTGGGLLARLQDYYADSEFESTELEGLIDEVYALRLRCLKDEGLIPILNALIEISHEAKLERKPLVVVAD